MKTLILILLALCISTTTSAQLEYYPSNMLKSPGYEILKKQAEEMFPQYKNHQRTADPAWFEEYMIAVQEELLYPGVSACILRDGEVYWKSHHGFANIAASTPIDDQTSYTVASISKTIMITATMQLYEQGLFELEDDINDHIPFPVRNYHHPDEVITIKQLMTHTSSIQDNYDVLIPALHWGGDHPTPMGDFLAGYLQVDSAFFENNNFYTYTPGASYNYSNVGSCILAYMVEIKTGLDFETYCQQNVFGPLEMEETSYLFANLDPVNIALPYTITGTNVSYTQQSTWPIYAIGNLKVSALQLGKHLGMYMNQGSYNDSILLLPSTVDLITEEHYTNNNIMVYMGLIWFLDPYPSFYSHSGRWFGFNTFYGFNKEDNSGMIWLSNGDNYNQIGTTLGPFWWEMIIYSEQYKPFSIESFSMTDEDGNGMLEAGESIEIFPGIRNNTNITSTVEDLTLTISSSSPYISSFTDSTIATGDINYLEVIENPGDPVSFQLSDQILPQDIALTINYSWGDGKSNQSTFDISVGHAEILLVCDEVDKRGKMIPTTNWYRQVLDSLGYNYQLYDLEMRGDPSASFINNFPVVIWFTGYDSLNTLTPENQNVLMDYLDNGGKLFLNGQNISDELAGTDFLEDYLHTEHMEDAWTNTYTLFGIDDDPIGHDIAFMIGSGDGCHNQNSPSIVEPLDDAHGVFTYSFGPEKAATRYANNTYKTVFFAFGYEGINNFDNRYKVMYRILNDYFAVIVDEKENQNMPPLIEISTISPNPTSGSALLKISNIQQETILIEVYNISGKKLKEILNEEKVDGSLELNIDLSDLPAGIYYCVIKTKNGLQPVHTKKLIKL